MTRRYPSRAVPRQTVMAYRRQLAYGEAVALRALVRKYGRWPRVQPLDVPPNWWLIDPTETEEATP